MAKVDTLFEISCTQRRNCWVQLTEGSQEEEDGQVGSGIGYRIRRVSSNDASLGTGSGINRVVSSIISGQLLFDSLFIGGSAFTGTVVAYVPATSGQMVDEVIVEFTSDLYSLR